MDRRDNFFRMVDQGHVCDQCKTPFETYDGFCSDQDGVAVCSWECVKAWCREYPEGNLAQTVLNLADDKSPTPGVDTGAANPCQPEVIPSQPGAAGQE